MDKTIFDTGPFAYVGNNKYYEDLTDDENRQLMHTSKDASQQTTIDDIEESSASVVGQMLPQMCSKESDEPDVDEVFSDAENDEKDIKTDEDEEETKMYNDDEFDLLSEALNDTMFGGEIYFESSKFIESLKNKFKKDDVSGTKPINASKVMRVAQLYTEMRLAGGRIKIATIKDSKFRTTTDYRDLKRKQITAEKNYRSGKKDLTKDELGMLTAYIGYFDPTFDKKLDHQIQSAKEAKAMSKTKTVKESTDIVCEKDLDPEMKPLIEKLHRKGYKTSSSSSGHNNITSDDDSNKNGVRDGRLYTDARLVFNGKYNLGKAPKYWYWKKVENGDEVDYLDVEELHYDTTPGGPSKAFQDWKIKYMKSLTDWVDSLPNVNEACNNNVDEACVEEACVADPTVDVNEQIDILMESMMSDLDLEILDI